MLRNRSPFLTPPCSILAPRLVPVTPSLQRKSRVGQKQLFIKLCFKKCFSCFYFCCCRFVCTVWVLRTITFQNHKSLLLTWGLTSSSLNRELQFHLQVSAVNRRQRSDVTHMQYVIQVMTQRGQLIQNWFHTCSFLAQKSTSNPSECWSSVMFLFLLQYSIWNIFAQAAFRSTYSRLYSATFGSV